MQIGMRIPDKMRELKFDELLAWSKEAGLGAIDLPKVDANLIKAVRAAGLSVGSVDLGDIGGSLSKDDSKRQAAVQSILRQIDELAALEGKTLFCCLIPEDRQMPRRETFAIFSETYPAIVAHAEKQGISLAMEPYPGPAPHYPTIGCTPEMYRAIFEQIPSAALGICYDPSHYMRLGIDYMRVLHEFGHRVRHVHAKDTEVLREGRYAFGTAGPTFPQEIRWAGGDWRYCIPGSGDVNWAQVIAHLKILGYQGPLSIELEDHVYGGSIPANQAGVQNAARHLQSVM